MAKTLVSDELWELVEPLIPKMKRRPDHPGRKRLDDRRVLTGILFVLRTGVPWEYLPREMGCGSGMTCWRRLRDWQQAGVWQELHELLLSKLQHAERIDWSRAAIDSSHVRAFGGRRHRPKPGRPCPQRLQAPPDLLRARHAAGRTSHGGQPQRRQRDDRPGRRRAGDARPARSPPAPSAATSTETAPTTPARAEPSCAVVASSRAWPDPAAPTARGSERGAGSWNARSPGCISTAACASATSAAATSTKPCLRSAAVSSASRFCSRRSHFDRDS